MESLKSLKQQPFFLPGISGSRSWDSNELNTWSLESKNVALSPSLDDNEVSQGG